MHLESTGTTVISKVMKANTLTDYFKCLLLTKKYSPGGDGGSTHTLWMGTWGAPAQVLMPWGEAAPTQSRPNSARRGCAGLTDR